jgi:hypothetical protein
MARKEATIVIEAEGRDKGKIFRLREMPAAKAEAWATRLLLCLANHGADVPQNYLDTSMAGLAVLGVHALTHVPWEAAKPLLDEIMTCVRIQPGANPTVVRDLIDLGGDGDDIEEVKTRLQLRDEVLRLHLGFSVADGFSILKANLSPAPNEIGQATETSPSPSEPS